VAVLTADLRTEPGAAPALGYLASLDGLRAVAALAVVAYHVEAGPLRGGFLGVDIFFVLSGFLITRLLLDERARTGRVALGRFWSRRARRLLPAMAAVVAAACAWAWLVQDAAARRQTAGDALASLLYVANWRFIRESSSYFAPLVEASPLRHLWSLSVEEQWYVVWPLVVVLVLRRGSPRVLAAVCGAGAVTSAVWMAVLATGDLDRAYYGTGSRAQGLLLGSFLAAAALAWPGLAGRASGRAGTATGWLSLAGVALLVASVDASDPWLYRGGFLMASLASAGVVAWLALGSRSPVHQVLGARGAVWLGKRSYALYLWHWPVVVALTPEVTGLAGPPLGALQATLAVVLAAASYRLVEVPVRTGLPARRGLVATGWAMTATAVLAVGLLLTGTPVANVEPGTVLALQAPSRSVGAVVAGGSPRPGVRPADAGRPVEPVPRAPAATTVPPVLPLDVVLLGDSQAFVVADDTVQFSLAPDLHLSAWATVGCGLAAAPVVSGGQTMPYPGAACDQWADGWRGTVEQAQPDVVVVHLGAWEVVDVLVDGQVLAVGTAAHDEWLLGRLRLAFEAAGASGAAVVALDVPCYAAREGRFTMASERNDPERVAHVNGLLRAAARDAGQRVAPHSSFVCDGGKERVGPGGARLRYDGVHYTKAGVEALWAWLTPLLREAAASGPLGPPTRQAQSVPSAR
jgi:peptidoglycan/LPS O-acetylase OafA/YrhL